MPDRSDDVWIEELRRELLDEFRTLVSERLEQLRAGWPADGPPPEPRRVFDLLHRLHGDLTLMGFPEVGLVTAKLQRMFELSRAGGFTDDSASAELVGDCIEVISQSLRPERDHRARRRTVAPLLGRLNTALRALGDSDPGGGHDRGGTNP